MANDESVGKNVEGSLKFAWNCVVNAMGPTQRKFVLLIEHVKVKMCNNFIFIYLVIFHTILYSVINVIVIYHSLANKAYFKQWDYQLIFNPNIIRKKI